MGNSIPTRTKEENFKPILHFLFYFDLKDKTLNCKDLILNHHNRHLLKDYGANSIVFQVLKQSDQNFFFFFFFFFFLSRHPLKFWPISLKMCQNVQEHKHKKTAASETRGTVHALVHVECNFYLHQKKVTCTRFFEEFEKLVQNGRILTFFPPVATRFATCRACSLLHLQFHPFPLLDPSLDFLLSLLQFMVNLLPFVDTLEKVQ